jgi:GT2 family glycosyltransferase
MRGGGKEKFISVIVLNWNGKHHLDECLGSLFNQTCKNFEAIVVDNGSTDGSVQHIRRRFPQVKLICLDQNRGFCGGNNLGLKHATGKFIALLNNDTLVSKSWLQELLQTMEEDQRTGLCASCMVDYFNPGIVDTAGDGYDACGIGYKIGNGRPVCKYLKPKRVFGACGGALLLRRSMIDAIGLFDEDFFAVGEDIDLSFRAKLSGYSCYYVPNAKVYHKVSQTIGTGSDFLLYHSRRNLEYTYVKNMPAILLIMTLPLHLIYNLTTLLQAVLERRLTAYLSAKRDFLRGFGNTVRKRRQVQKLRVISTSELLSSFSWSYLPRKLIQQLRLLF